MDIFVYMQISTKYKKIFTKVHFGTATLDTTFREFTHTHTHCKRHTLEYYTEDMSKRLIGHKFFICYTYELSKFHVYEMVERQF